MSYPRLVFLVGIIGLLVFGGTTGWQWFKETQVEQKEPWFAGYVDVTAQPQYSFERGATQATKHTVLSFVVNHGTEECTPTWGAHYTLGEAAQLLDLDRRIARANSGDREVLISFGGELNFNLAESCDSVTDLKSAYLSVLDRYDVDSVDFDIEGASLVAHDANQRRASAVAEIQTERRERGEQLAVWLTLPVGTTGLTDSGVRVLEQMLKTGVDVSGVNLMTMNYNVPETGLDLYQGIISSIQASHRQISSVYHAEGFRLSGKDIWQKIGVTPMIGQNMVPGEVFTMEMAKDLNRFLVENGVRRVSMWSLNRDNTCSLNLPNQHLVSDSCSGVQQGDLYFSDQLGADMLGFPNAGEHEETNTNPPGGIDSGSENGQTGGLFPGEGQKPIVDDPESSPYPIWNESSRYPAGTKVTWQKNVYRSKWWNERVQPGIPTASESDNPWEYIGPVLPGEKPIEQITLPEGLYPDWNPTATYTKGKRVILDSYVYEAQWWTQGDSPDRTLSDPGNSPWLLLDENELLKILQTQ